MVCAQLKREGSMGASSQSSVEGEYDVGTAIDLPPQQQQQVNPNNNTNICVFFAEFANVPFIFPSSCCHRVMSVVACACVRNALVL